MKWDDLAEEPCSVARTLAVVGDRWTMLILRNCFNGMKRFDEFQENLGISRTIVTERLALLTKEGVLERVTYQERPTRFEYSLSQKGLDLYPLLMAMFRWGDRYYGLEDGPPALFTHRKCGCEFHAVMTCSECCEELSPREVTVKRGPGFRGRFGEKPKNAPARSETKV